MTRFKVGDVIVSRYWNLECEIDLVIGIIEHNQQLRTHLIYALLSLDSTTPIYKHTYVVVADSSSDKWRIQDLPQKERKILQRVIDRKKQNNV